MTEAPDTSSPVGGLQRRLALEHEAVWLSSLVAARFDPLRDRAEAAYRRHRGSRDDLMARIATAGATAVGPQAAYGVPPATADEARARMADVLDRLCRATLPLVTLGGPDERREAMTALRDSARSAVAWGAAPTPLPGLD